ncbi:DNA/RNA non-specific endonuclease [Rhodoferax sp. 4810]|uniref:Endonuclease n=1 Tax=Thiospirillum jenense TaxID=1653858 RepID=A0A839HBG4_9GAMM|nr:DNA/RNA non-specific endonuclease [Thiospirillum jenense]MBB1076163.1 DNA/RNA non-specific endonuclease [Rhodoferax jenense]MBB1126051.1 DNA/RNA non-specific endonuclease [Thiospirillum jenense]
MLDSIQSSAGQVRDICFDSFAVLHSGETKTPVYVVERLNRARLQDAQDEQRTDKFYEEARLPSLDRALLSDYKGSGFDRGHMAPAADMPNPNAMAQSFSLANMIPQAPDLNRGIWAKSVEAATRKYVMRASGDVFVFTGAVVNQPVSIIGASQVWVPSHVYKLVYDADKNQAWAFWVENTDDARMSKPISYAELVKRVGIEFLPGVTPLARSVEAVVESVPIPSQGASPVQFSAGCGDKTTCKQMSDCAEARHYLTECGLSRLDRDGDGVPCESLCLY